MSAGPTKLSRSATSVLVVCNNGTISNQLRQSLKTLGFHKLASVPTHVAALDRIKARNIPLILLDSKSTDMEAADFVEKVISEDENCVMIAISSEPRVDDVFSVLRAGARGFLAVPFTVDTVEEVISAAEDGPALSEAVLNSPDRNAALVGVVLNNLYKLSVLMRQAREFESAKRELERQHGNFMESIELARLFCEGSDEALLEKFVEGCINRANNAATRLGRTRKKLRAKRDVDDDGQENAAQLPPTSRSIFS